MVFIYILIYMFLASLTYVIIEQDYMDKSPDTWESHKLFVVWLSILFPISWILYYSVFIIRKFYKINKYLVKIITNKEVTKLN